MSYVIDWSSNGAQGIIGKASIVLADKSYDSSSSSLVLTGKGVSNWGEIQQENFLHLLESFASDTAPLNPTIGQLWFNPDEHALYVCVDPTTIPASIPKFHATGNYAWIKTGAGSASEIAAALGYVPVESVNGKTGQNITLVYADITSALGYVAVKSVNGKTGQTITLAPADIPGLDPTSSPTFNAVTVVNDVTTRGGRGVAVNPTTPLDGDIQVVGSVISIRAAGVWRQVFPAVYS